MTGAERDFVVQHDGEVIADVLARGIAETHGAARRELKIYLVAVPPNWPLARLRVAHVHAGDDRRSFRA